MEPDPVRSTRRFRLSGVRLALAFLALGVAVAAEARPCTAQSGPNTTALVELYTSEGCSSCPPADRWLSSLAARGYVPERVVPIALHVDYWDYIGWKDPYAKRDFSLRQRKLTQLQRLALVYTPQVMLQGRDFRGWGTAAFDEAVAQINARPARARLGLEIVSVKSDALTVRATAEVRDASQQDAAALYLGVYENRLESRVTRGENRGRTLAHDHVVLDWHGPIAFSEPSLVVQREMALLPKAAARDSGVVGFVQHRRSAEVLQALLLPACP
jgi:hypothetical protein